jgi:hypothetical protein
MGQVGVCRPGRRPFVQRHDEMLFITSGSFAMMLIGTLWLAPSPLTIDDGWWSPRTINTVLRFA